MTRGGGRGWEAFVVTGMVTLVLLLLWTLMVVEPTETASGDPGSLYAAMDPSRWFSLAVLGCLWLCGVAAVTAVTVIAGSAGQRPASPAGLLPRRVTAATGGIGLVAAVSPVIPGFPVSLGWYTLAEQLGTAPPTGSMSDLSIGIFFTGCALLLMAGAGLITMAVRSLRRH